MAAGVKTVCSRRCFCDLWLSRKRPFWSSSNADSIKPALRVQIHHLVYESGWKLDTGACRPCGFCPWFGFKLIKPVLYYYLCWAESDLCRACNLFCSFPNLVQDKLWKTSRLEDWFIQFRFFLLVFFLFVCLFFQIFIHPFGFAKRKEVWMAMG